MLVKFLKEDVEDDSDPIVSMVIFEWKDFDLIGVLPTPDSLSVCRNLSSQYINANKSYRKSTFATSKPSRTNIAP